MHKVRQFHRRAQECLENAANAATGEMRSRYEELAHTWRRLADERLTFFVPCEEAERNSGTEA